VRFCKSDTDTERLEKAGPADIVLRRDTGHLLHADYCELTEIEAERGDRLELLKALPMGHAT
jgi:hypothetical protein